jgi:hypothetical protein
MVRTSRSLLQVESTKTKMNFNRKLGIDPDSFGIRNYKLSSPSPDEDGPARYFFSSLDNELSNAFTGLMYILSQGESSKLLTHYNVVLAFDDMSHEEMIKFSCKHNSLEMDRQLGGR